ncbi:MAG: hypothetical protein KBT04_03805, partial [Bacteroidales bacterium]|nr:hypothetical protein [Candidatus Colimorpha onthohippi]
MKNCKVVVTLLTLYLSLHVAATAQISSPDTLMKYLRNLCSSRYEGRLAGSQGYDNAAKYVTNQLRNYGVKPYEEDWIQHYFEVECNQIENASLEVYFPWSNERMEYILGNDFSCAGMTGRGYIDAPVVFCGYGIDNAAFNEYAKV